MATMQSTLLVKVIPKSSTNAVVGWENDYLKIKIRGAPEKGIVNRALIEFLSDYLDIPLSAVQLKKGDKSRLKQFQIDGISEEQLLKKIKDNEEKNGGKKRSEK